MPSFMHWIPIAGEIITGISEEMEEMRFAYMETLSFQTNPNGSQDGDH